MNILRNPQGELRRNLVVIGAFGALALGLAENGDHQPPNAAAMNAEAQKNDFLKSAAIKIGKVIMCEQGQTAGIPIYSLTSEPRTLVSFEAAGKTASYEVDAVLAVNRHGQPVAAKTRAVLVEQVRPIERSLKIISVPNSAGLDWQVTDNFNPSADPFIQYNPEDIGGRLPAITPKDQVALAKTAWLNTKAAAHLKSSVCE